MLARLEIFKGHVHRARANADHFGRGANPSGVEHLGQNGPTAINLADDGVGIQLHTVQLYMRSNSGIDKPCRLHRKARRVLVHREQGQTIGFASRTRGTRRNDQHVR